MNPDDAHAAAPRKTALRRIVVSVLVLVGICTGLTVAMPAAVALIGAAAVAGFAIGLLVLRVPAGDAIGVVRGPDGEARALVRQVIPVWQRTAELARTTAERDAGALAERFANVHSQLDIALGATSEAPVLDGAAIDALLERHGEGLQRLQLDAREALDALAAVLAVAEHVDAAAEKLSRLAGDMQRIARATHMLGLNASVEAARISGAHGSFEVVASDVRELAAQSQSVADRMSEQVHGVREHVATLRDLRRAVRKDDEDLSLRIEINARGVLRALLSSLGESARSSHVLRDAGRQAQSDIEAILMNLQGHDRVNQMLESVIGDISRMSEVLDVDAPPATNAAEWLHRLESSYTMEEMRTSHHGTKAIDAQATVEFF